jgi:hypothetical protein
MKHHYLYIGTLLAGTAFFFGSAASANAQVMIDQGKALAGAVTPGDAPGFPITLAAPGTYKLTSDLVVPAGTDGVRIAADNVTLDLNGYTIKGALECSGSGDELACGAAMSGSGVIAEQGTQFSTLRNGIVRSFGLEGVMLGASATIDGINARGNGTYGIVAYENTTIANSQANRNGAHGMLLMYGGSVVISSQVVGNKGHGFVLNGDDAIPRVAMASEVRKSFAAANGNAGFLSLGVPGMWIANTASSNASCFDQGTLVRDNVCDGGSMLSYPMAAR